MYLHMYVCMDVCVRMHAYIIHVYVGRFSAFDTKGHENRVAVTNNA